MTEKKEIQHRPIIEYKAVKPFVDAAALAGGCASFALVPVVDNPAGKAALVGTGFSLFWYWGSGNLSLPKAAQRAPRNAGRKIKVQGEKWTFDQVAPGQFVTRQSAFKDFLGFLGGNKHKVVQRNATPSVPKPGWMTELVFHSHCNGYPCQILVQDAFRFLRLAQKLQREKGKGKGLSKNTWIRYAHERPLWYQELPCPSWYHAMMNLIYAAERYGEKQLIVEVGPRQIALAREASQVLEALRWLEDQRGS